MPNHDSNQSPGTGGYTLEWQGQFYTPGADYGNVKIQFGPPDIDGFLIVAQDSKGNYLGAMRPTGGGMNNEPATKFQPACAGHGQTHAQTVFRTTPVTLDYKPPTSNVGPITLKAVIVRGYFEWYVLTSSTAITVAPTPPGPVGHFVISQVLDTSVSLDWAVPTVSGSSVVNQYVVTVQNATFARNFSTTGTHFDALGLRGNSSYQFTVYAVNAETKIGPPAGILSTRTFPLGQLPPVPDPISSIVLQGVGITYLSLAWTPPDFHLAALVLYNLQVGSSLNSMVDVYFGQDPSFNVTNLKDNTTFYVRVRARSTIGNGNFSAVQTFSTSSFPPCPGDCTSPSHGICLKGTCRCKVSYVGDRCNITGARFCTDDSYWCLYFGIQHLDQGIDKAIVHMQWVINGITGWVGVMIGASDGMTGGDAWVGEFNNQIIPPSTQFTTLTVPSPDDTSVTGFRTRAADGTWGFVPMKFGPQSSGVFVPQDIFGTPNQDDSSIYAFNGTDIDTVTGNVRLEDEWSVGFQAPALDTVQNLELVVGWQLNGRTLYQFSRPAISADDQQDVNIIAPGLNFVSWAHGKDGFIKHADNARGRLLVDFSTGFVTEIDLPSISQYLAPLIILLIMCTAAFVLRTFCWNSPDVWAARFCYHTRLFPKHYAKRSLLDKLTWDLRLAIFNTSVGEFAVICAFWIMFGVFVAVTKKNNADVYRNTAYVHGHITALLYACAVLPPTKNSIFSKIFGIPFERAIKYHRWLGRFAVIYNIVHLITMLEYRGTGVLLSGVETSRGGGVVYGFFAFLCFATMFVMAFEPIRRYSYEVFRYTHFLALPGVVLAIFHSTDFIIVASGPLALYGIDMCIRIYRKWLRKAKVVSMTQIPMQGGASITRLELQLPGFSYEAGDYCFVNLPSVSPLNFHPFSISSPPGEAGESFTFHILNMGQGTYTGDIAALKSAEMARVDGPYGKLAVPVHRYECVVLCAGGVGVTPLMSILGDLHNKYAKNQLPNLKAVYLVWSSKHAESFTQWFPDTLNKVKQPVTTGDGPHARFELKFYISGKDNATELSNAPAPVSTGRPKYSEIIGEAKKLATTNGSAGVAVLACGPEAMVADVQLAALAQECHFHNETFFL